MIAPALILIPLLFAALSLTVKHHAKRIRALLVVAAIVHTTLSAVVFAMPDADWIAFRCGGRTLLSFDCAGTIVLAITSLLFLLVSIHTYFWLPAEQRLEQNSNTHKTTLLKDFIFIPCLLAFLSMMTLVTAAQNFGLLWVAVEATTLVSAPLILFHRSAHSLEAMWKYLLICSVGIGFALFGTMLLAVAGGAADEYGLDFQTLLSHRKELNPDWFKAAFLFILAGYGTKMGLAPFHTWLPDAHSEAPGTVSALLSGSLLNCSFLAIIRFSEITPQTLRPFCNTLFIALGVLSLLVAAFFIIRQSDFKRMLAYSSVEQMGLAAILWGLGLDAITFLHLAGHSLIKMTLFLTAGNILLAYGTRRISKVHSMLSSIPRNAVLWLLGLLLICGVPPSPLFITEFFLFKEANPWLGLSVLVLLLAIFCGMSMACLKMAMGAPDASIPEPAKAQTAESLWLIPALTLAAVVAGGTLLTVYCVGAM